MNKISLVTLICALLRIHSVNNSERHLLWGRQESGRNQVYHTHFWASEYREVTFQLLVVPCWREWAMGADYLVSNPGFSINQQWGLWHTGKHYLILNLYSSYRTREISEWVKVLTFKSDDLNMIARTHMVVRTISWKSSDLHTCAPMGPHTCTYTMNK